ncbi:M10 family metallopeptidase C-terminal domain-containing protein [Sphingobium sp. 3R8]|uniref:M10 family metallopeptidase n=1 Tax=Sphingobium sp. 3R8 TaxID=2874921 RepID=UPI001CCC137D|nr:M10 family metallopeptidase [Sphingobium sp. 3R8]MBZ9647468.1 M10 family metallopeptidase C-terminal domain-containing protein [Sphingobium sp. 3R8]
MFKVTGSGPVKVKLTPDYSLPSTSDASGSRPEFTGTWSLAREAQVRSEVRLLYPMDAPTPPATTPSSGDLAENGSASTTVTVGATGDARIDGILRGVAWSGGITYSDVDSTADYQSGYFSDSDGDGTSAQNEGFSQFTAQQLLAMHSALNAATYTQLAGAYGFSIEGFTNLTIDYAGAGLGTATIRGANSSDAPTAYAYYPANNIYGGDTFFGNAYDGTSNSLKNPVAGNYAWHTMLHELGHSLGLKHGQETGGVSNVALPTAWDSIEFSVMTYRSYVGAPLSGYSYEEFGAPQTYMMLDIAALQTMYGADYTVHAENTTYSWNPSTGITYINGDIAIQPGDNRIFATIWDGGGVDTYDLSAYSSGVTIDLTPGGYSLFSGTQQAYLGGGNYARGNIFNALTFGGSNASLIENATGGSGGDTITGNAVGNLLKGGGGTDTIYGGDGNDVIQGGFNADFVYGEAGDDVFQVLQGEFGDNIDGGIGTDRLDLSNYTTTYGATVDLSAGTWDFNPSFGGPYTITGVENVDGTQLADTITGDSNNNVLNGNGGNDTLKGGIGQDTIYGGDGNDIIQGGFGADTVYGEAGDDVFQVLQGEFGDNINGGIGTDRLDLSDYTATYGATVDLSAGTWDFNPSFGGPYTITGVENVDGTQLADTIIGDGNNNVIDGNGGNDTLKGGIGQDTIYGGDGNDIIQGGFGTDFVYGEAGNDVFQVLQGEFGDNVDGGSGTDRLDLSDYTATYGATVDLAAGSWDFNPSFGGPYTITGVEDVDGTQLADTLTGNSANNVLNGNGGDDVLSGGAGNDTISGGSGDDQMIGGTGNDIFDGGSGVDTAYGEAGDDIYKVIAGWNGGYGELFSGGAGVDTIDGSALSSDYVVNLSDGEFAISGGSGLIALASVENATTGSGNDTLTGSAEANRLIGNAGTDTLNGLDGNDVLQGGTGNDRLNGGLGDDTLDGGADVDTVTYAGMAAGVTVSLAIAGAQNTIGAGTDTLVGIENLAGTSFNDVLTGNGGANVLTGGAGSDTLDGGAGADTMDGGTSSDIYYVDNVGDNVVESFSTGGTDDQIFSSVTYSLSGRHIEKLTLTGSANINATGNDLAQTITGNSGNNSLSGLGGKDVLNGGLGNDMIDGGAGNDTASYAGIAEGVIVSLAIAGAQDTVSAGTDTLVGIENLTGTSFDDGLIGNGGANVLIGGAGLDILDGGAGADIMDGGTSNDLYYVDNVGDNVVESFSSGGTDDQIFSSVTYSLAGRHIERLTLLGSANIDGTGNDLAQTITGNSGNNSLSGLGGNDILNGGLGNDMIDGGAGVDTANYAGAAAGVTVSLAIAGAQNTVNAGTDTLVGIENLSGTTFNDILTGNGAANVITGGSGSDTINGGAGADTMDGGTSSDIYYVDNVGDNVVESFSSGGTDDQIFSSVTYSLAGRHIEKLILTGAANINATGNDLGQTITGNSGNNILSGLGGNDVLNGGLGADTLMGGTGADIFLFNSTLGGGNVDTMASYVVADDTIQLDDAIFTGLALGTLSAAQFQIGSAANDAADRIIYNSATGALLFDADGTGAIAAVQFATIGTGLSMVASEFVIV